MFHKGKSLFLTLIIGLVFAAATLAAAPAEGLVFEGVSVPGAAIGDTRTAIEVAYGAPSSCQSVYAPGDNGYCAYPVEDGGRVWVRYWGADGGTPANAPDDTVSSFQWLEPLIGWTTTAGINSVIAKADPDAVIAAYPDALLTYTSWGSLYSAIDYAQGIRFHWLPNIYAGTVTLSITITSPSDPPPPPPPRDPMTIVTDIDLSANKEKGRHTVTAFVKIEDERTFAAEGATVHAAWILPDGTVAEVEAVTSGAGWAYFAIGDAARGTYTLLIQDVTLENFTFDEAKSVMNASLNVK